MDDCLQFLIKFEMAELYNYFEIYDIHGKRFRKYVDNDMKIIVIHINV